MTRDAFPTWAEGQTARYQRIAGEPVAMSPERVIHARLKARVWQALDRALRSGVLDGDLGTAKILLRDFINATVGFADLGSQSACRRSP